MLISKKQEEIVACLLVRCFTTTAVWLAGVANSYMHNTKVQCSKFPISPAIILATMYNIIIYTIIYYY
jgi:hypothetical protein